MNIKCLAWALVLLGLAQTARAQDMVFLKAIPIYAWGNNDMGGAGYSAELRGQLRRVGLKLDYVNSYTSESTPKHYYNYFNTYAARASWQFSNRKGLGLEIGHLLNLGYNHTTAYKHQLFQAVDPTLAPPIDNPDETQRQIAAYYTNMKVSSNYMSIGYERLKKHDVKFAGWVEHLLLNPFGFVVGRYRTLESGEVFYTSSLYFDFLVLTPNGHSYTPIEYYNISGGKPETTDNLIMETLYKNNLGFRMGYEITTLTSFGLTFGLEAGMMPGIYHYSSDYGQGFPQDNIYFGAKAGFAFGYAPKP